MPTRQALHSAARASTFCFSFQCPLRAFYRCQFTILNLVVSQVEARNAFESYAYSLRNSMDEGLGAKLSEGDKTTLSEAITSALAWLDDNQSAEKEEMDARRKELEDVAMPILQKASSGSSPADGEPTDGEPTVEEAD